VAISMSPGGGATTLGGGISGGGRRDPFRLNVTTEQWYDRA